MISEASYYDTIFGSQSIYLMNFLLKANFSSLNRLKTAPPFNREAK